MINQFYIEEGASIVPLEPHHYQLTAIADNTVKYRLADAQMRFVEMANCGETEKHIVSVINRQVCLVSHDHATARGFIARVLGWTNMVLSKNVVGSEAIREYLDVNTEHTWLMTWMSERVLHAYHFESENDAVMFNLAFADTYMRESDL